jgi:enoyl-CoA hydratase/carnithine racemase
VTGTDGGAAAPALLSVEDGAVAFLSLNRPEVRNAIDDALQAQLITEIERIATRSTVRVVVLTGEGTAFCSGGDVRGMQDRLTAQPGQVAAVGWRRLRRTQQMICALHDLPAVTIAAVNGPALGVGLDLALACDFVVASEAASFSSAFIARGLVPDGGGMYYLPRRVGLARAKDLVFSGRRVDAGEALALGLADHVVDASELDTFVRRLAFEYAAVSPVAIALAKSILNRTFESTREVVFARSAEAQAICYTTDEHRASVDAFLNASKSRSHPE